MRGEVLAYDDGPGTGWISGDDGNRYSFARSDLQQLTPLRAGTRVDFITADGAASQIFIVAGQHGRAAAASRSASSEPGMSGSGLTLDWRKLFFDASGRIVQRDYWIGFGIVFAASLILGWIPLFGLIVSLAAAYAGICVSSKRLHDMGRSGWLAAVPYGVFVAVTLLSGASLAGMMGAASYDSGLGVAAGAGFLGLLWIAAVIVNLGFVIWLGVTAGQPDENAYGPPPTPLANF